MGIGNALRASSPSFSTGKEGCSPVCQGVITQNSCPDLQSEFDPREGGRITMWVRAFISKLDIPVFNSQLWDLLPGCAYVGYLTSLSVSGNTYTHAF